MIRWRKQVEEYVELRRSLGFKLRDAHNGLIQFASFLEQTELYWAITLAGARNPTRSRRPRNIFELISFVLLGSLPEFCRLWLHLACIPGGAASAPEGSWEPLLQAG